MNRVISNRYSYGVLVVFICIFFVISLSHNLLDNPPILETTNKSSPILQSTPTITKEEAVVTAVIDGDTIEINGQTKVRYIGIDTPEIANNNCHAAAAKERNTTLVLGQKIRLEKDISETDRYDRLLRYVYLPDGTFINKILVEEGHARTVFIKPDVSQYEYFRSLEDIARKEQKGIWGTCPVTF